jgi:hypothetical protein
MTEAPSLESDQWREEGPWLLLALLPLAALAFRRGWLVPMLACAIILPPTPGWAFGWSDLWWRADQQAARQLEAGAEAAAAARFQDPAWRAAASYRAGDYARALAALADVPDPEADYNRGTPSRVWGASTKPSLPTSGSWSGSRTTRTHVTISSWYRRFVSDSRSRWAANRGRRDRRRRPGEIRR